MAEPTTLQDKKIVLADGSSFTLLDYILKEKDCLTIQVKSISFSDVEKIFTEENTKSVEIYNCWGEKVGSYSKLVLAGRVIFDKDDDYIELTLNSGDLEKVVSDLKSLVQTLQEEIQELKSTQSISEDNQDVIIEYLAEEIGGEDENTEV